MSSLQTVSALRAKAQQIIDILAKDGCIAITDMLPAPQLHKLREDLNAGFQQTPACQGNFFGFSTKRMSSILRISNISRDMAIHPLVLSAMDHFLLKSCREYQLNLSQAIQIFPGEPAQFIHTDDLMFPFELPILGDQKMINCMWAVDDFTCANGATNLVPGSHFWPRDRQPTEYEIVQGAMPAGSLLIYFGSLLHGGGTNMTNKPRTGLVLSYGLGWLRQAENHYLALPRELVRQFPERLQKLLGYFVHAPNLGAIEGRDPIEFLQNGDFGNHRFEEFIPAEFHGPLEEYRRIQMLSYSRVRVA